MLPSALKPAPAADSDDSFSEEDKPIATQRHKRNIYEELTGNDNSEEEAENANRCDESESEKMRQVMANKATKAMKKKKKQKRKQKPVAAAKMSNAEQKNVNRKDECALSAIELNEGACGGVDLASITKQLLAVDLRHLDPNNEIRRVFGKDVLKAEMRRNVQQASVRPTVMVKQKANWPFIDRNHITMSLINAPNCELGTNPSKIIKWFSFKYNEAYNAVQTSFLLAMKHSDRHFMFDTINKHYHLPTILYMSDFCRTIDMYARATEFIERGVFALETAFHPSFSYTDGNCRLSYRYRENRIFFVLLFKFAQCLEGRALYRTALEVTKFLLNLNPDEDPIALVLVMDYYALRSKEYKWLIDFYEQLETSRQLFQLPNMAFSYALALFHFRGDNDTANTALRNAILKFPSVLRPLLNEIGLNADDYIDKSADSSTDASAEQTVVLNRLISLYICRAKQIWSPSNVQKWLLKNVRYVSDVIIANDKSVMNTSDVKKEGCYVDPPLEMLRHIILGNFGDRVSISPFMENVMQSMYFYDPLPPMDESDSTISSSSSSNRESLTTGIQSSLSLFMHSFMPLFNLLNPTNSLRSLVPNWNDDVDVDVDELQRQLENLDHETEHNADEPTVRSESSNISLAEFNLD